MRGKRRSSVREAQYKTRPSDGHRRWTVDGPIRDDLGFVDADAELQDFAAGWDRLMVPIP
jgi:recombinational DNA repair ATPase RecF